MTLRPTGRVGGKVRVPLHEEVPKSIQLRFEPSPELQVGAVGNRIPRTSIDCPVKKGAFDCEIPATDLDIRLRAEQFVSHYFWKQRIDKDQPLNLGSIQLERGASVSGRVQLPADAPSKLKTTVQLAPYTAGLSFSTPDRERLLRLAFRTRANDRGFFHFTGVQPGSYVLSADVSGLVSGNAFPILVLENAETELQNPLVLKQPLDLEVQVEPSTDPFGGSWRISLWAESTIPGNTNAIVEGQIAENGRFTARDLAPGGYLVFVEDAAGSTLATEQIELAEGQDRLTLDLPLVFVDGEIHLEDEPLSAELVFGGHITGSVRLVSDEEGKFFGYLPRAGSWLVYVEAQAPPVQRYLWDIEVEDGDHLSLQLPDIGIEGRVVDEEGEVAGGALVRLQDETVGRKVTAEAKADGSFHFRGLDEGSYTVAAEDGGRVSQSVNLRLRKEIESPPLDLVLQKRQTLRGTVISPRGPVPGSLVYAYVSSRPGSPPHLTVEQAITDAAGGFLIQVPSQTTTVRFSVFPPGYNLTTVPDAEIVDKEFLINVSSDGGSVHLRIEREAYNWATPALGGRVELSGPDGLINFYELTRWAGINGLKMAADFRDLIVPALPAGPYKACYYPLAGAEEATLHRDPECQEFTIVPYGQTLVEF